MKESMILGLLFIFSVGAQTDPQAQVNSNISFLYSESLLESRVESIGSWITSGEAVFDQNNLRLLDTLEKDSFGKAFFSQDIVSTSWSIVIELDLSAIEKMQQNQYDLRGGLYPERGFALWHLTGPNVESSFSEFGPIFGHPNNYRGVGIFFYNRRMKEIMIHARVNTGEPIQEVLPSGYRFRNSCIQKIPDKEHAKFLIQNTPNELKVSVWQKNRWKGCLNNREVAIKGPGFIGVSASNLGIAPQFITIKSFEFMNEDPAVNLNYIRRPSVFSKMAMNKSKIKKDEFDASKQYLIQSMVRKYVTGETEDTQQKKPPIQANAVPPTYQTQQNAGYQQNQVPPQTPPPTQNPYTPPPSQNQYTPPTQNPPPTYNPPPSQNPPPTQGGQTGYDNYNQAAQTNQQNYQAVGDQNYQRQPDPAADNPYAQQDTNRANPPPVDQKIGFSLSESDYNNMLRSILQMERKFQDLDNIVKELSTKESMLENRLRQELKSFANQIRELTVIPNDSKDTSKLQTNLANLEKNHSQTKSEQSSKIQNLEREVTRLKNELSMIKYNKKPESSGGSSLLWIAFILALLIAIVAVFLYLRKAREEGGSKFHLP